MDFKSFGDGDVNVGMAQGSNFPLARQSSIYSLTFDELQTSFSGFGKEFGSMNMDELLKTIWSADETQAPIASNSVGCGEVSSCAGGLLKQSSLTLPTTLSQKTVDQVRRDLDSGPVEMRTVGEMTLEDFLMKAGVSMETTLNTNSQNATMTSVEPPKMANLHPLFPKPASVTFSTSIHPTSKPQLPNIAPKSTMIGMSNTSFMRTLAKSIALDVGDGNSSESSPYGYSPIVRGRRGNAGVEKVVERRHRRMIKNRESAARSRARKQAYTLELEAEIAKLREMNDDLVRKQGEILEIQKDEMMEKMRRQWCGKRVCLRRTVTGPW